MSKEMDVRGGEREMKAYCDEYETMARLSAQISSKRRRIEGRLQLF